MDFRIEISGTQNEGVESRARFDKITRAYIEQLGSNGFIADYAVSSPDMKLNPVNLLLSKGGDPEPASWQAATVSDAERAPAKAEAALVATANQPAISKAAERITDIKLQPEIDGHSNTTTTTTEADSQAAVLTVEFASNAAAELADENDLTDTHFTDLEPSGSSGFTVADVKEAIDAKDATA